MTLIDTGPLVAMLDRGQPELHRKCVAVCAKLTTPLLSTWPCFTEAMYFLYHLREWEAQDALWELVANGCLRLHTPSANEWQRMRTLMEKYQDTPMDLADASLVVMAETMGLRQIFTLDDDFYIYRINDRDSFEVIPMN